MPNFADWKPWAGLWVWHFLVILTCLFIDFILYVPVNSFSVMSGQVFLGWTSLFMSRCHIIGCLMSWLNYIYCTYIQPIFCLHLNTVKPVLSGHWKRDKTKICLTKGNLMKVESLQYFWPSSVLKNSFKKQCLVFLLSGRLRQLLLYLQIYIHLMSFAIFDWRLMLWNHWVLIHI